MDFNIKSCLKPKPNCDYDADFTTTFSRRKHSHVPGLFVPNLHNNRRSSVAQTLYRRISPSTHHGTASGNNNKVEPDYLNFASNRDFHRRDTLLETKLEEVRTGSISHSHFMGRAMRVVVVGSKKVGKTCILRQVACVEDLTQKPYSPTIDDTYQVLLEEGDRPREILVFHDTGGIPEYGPAELKKPYMQVADAFVLVYSISDHESFNRVDLIKKYIEKQLSKEKKEIPIVVLGNMRDLPLRKVDTDFAQSWAARERVKLFEVSAKDRNSLVDFVHYLGQRHFHPIKESKFSLSKRLRSDKPNNAILMDF